VGPPETPRVEKIRRGQEIKEESDGYTSGLMGGQGGIQISFTLNRESGMHRDFEARKGQESPEVHLTENKKKANKRPTVGSEKLIFYSGHG